MLYVCERFVLGGQLCSETGFVFAGNLFNTSSLQEFHKATA